MICLFCGKEFEIIEIGSGGKNRLFCYDCYPSGMPRKQRESHLRYLKQTLYNRQKLEKGCAVCGYNKCAAALEWHHPNDDKINDPSKLRSYSIEKYLEEINKCEVLCANCHRELHFNINNKQYELPIANNPIEEYKELEQKVIDLYHIEKTYKQVSLKLGINERLVKQICEKHNVYYEKSNNKKPVAMINKETEEIEKTFESISDALRFLNKSTNLGGKISRSCNNNRCTAFGYKWKYI